MTVWLNAAGYGEQSYFERCLQEGGILHGCGNCGDAIVLAAAMGGATVGQALIPILGLGALVGNIVGAAMARLAIDKVDSVVLGVAADTGWTVFGLVDQNYTVPRELLRASGWNVLDISTFTPRPLDVRRVRLRTIELKKIDMTVLRRGVISFGRVGYLA